MVSRFLQVFCQMPGSSVHRFLPEGQGFYSRGAPVRPLSCLMGLNSWPVLMKSVFLTSTHLSNLDEITAELKHMEADKVSSLSLWHWETLIAFSLLWVFYLFVCVCFVFSTPDSSASLKPSSIFVSVSASPVLNLTFPSAAIDT